MPFFLISSKRLAVWTGNWKLWRYKWAFALHPIRPNWSLLQKMKEKQRKKQSSNEIAENVNWSVKLQNPAESCGNRCMHPDFVHFHLSSLSVSARTTLFQKMSCSKGFNIGVISFWKSKYQYMPIHNEFFSILIPTNHRTIVNSASVVTITTLSWSCPELLGKGVDMAPVTTYKTQGRQGHRPLLQLPNSPPVASLQAL